MLRKKVIEPLYESKSIWWIWSELGRKMGYGEYFLWNSDEEVAEHFFSTSGIGACLVREKSGEIIERGHNRQHSPYFRSDLHAEMDLLDRAP
jgi:anaerobic selenocysteine-containing dehydrogenase